MRVDGTLNKREDQDKGWTVELAIPLEDVKGMDDKSALKLPPAPGDVWRINMFRMDMPQGKPQQAAGWSPPMVGDFHALDRFGELVFGDAQGAVPPPPPPRGARAGEGEVGRRQQHAGERARRPQGNRRRQDRRAARARRSR